MIIIINNNNDDYDSNAFIKIIKKNERNYVEYYST